MLTKETGNGNGQGAFTVVIDHGIGPGVFFPRGQKIENANGGDGGGSQGQGDFCVHCPDVCAVDPGGFHDFARNILHKALDHEGGEGNHPGHIKRNQAPQLIDHAQLGGKLKLRHDHGGAGNDHGDDDEGKQQIGAFRFELAQHKGHGRTYCGCQGDGGNGYDHRIEKIQIKPTLMQNIIIVFQCQRFPLGKEARRIFIKRTIGPQRSRNHVDHGQSEDHRAQGQQQIADDSGTNRCGIFAFHLAVLLTHPCSASYGTVRWPAAPKTGPSQS